MFGNILLSQLVKVSIAFNGLNFGPTVFHLDCHNLNSASIIS
jgi:hypothetical protein